MNYRTIKAKQTYQAHGGEVKTRWLEIGTIAVDDGYTGKIYVTINSMPNAEIWCPENKARDEVSVEESMSDEIRVEDIPFND